MAAGVILEPQIDAFPSAAINSTFVRFRLRGFAGSVPQFSGAPVTVSATTAVGTIAQAVCPNDAITPAGTFYTVEMWANGRVTSSRNYLFLSAAPVAQQITIPGTTGTYVYTGGVKNTSIPYDWNTGATTPITITAVAGKTVSLTYVSGTINTQAGIGSGANIDGTGNNDDPAGRGIFNNNFNRYAGEWVAAGFVPVATGCCLGAFTDGSGNVIGTPFVIDNGGSFVCPVGAVQLQVGVNDAFSFADNTGAWVFNTSSFQTVSTYDLSTAVPIAAKSV